MRPALDTRDSYVLSIRLVTGLHRQLEVEARGTGHDAALAEAGLMILRSVTRYLLDRVISTPPAERFRVAS